MILQYITWDPRPEIFSWQGFEVRWYGLLFALSFYFGYLIMKRIFKKENVDLKVLDALTMYMGLGTILGARLGHCFFYEPQRYLANPLEILKIWEGGLASHGAAIGIIVALWLFTKKYKKPFFWIIDRIVIVVALSGFFIRMGNLMNSEIFGTQTSLPWGFIFSSFDDVPRHPTQIYEALCYLVIFLFLIKYYYKKNGSPAMGVMFGWFLMALFTVRLLIEFIKLDQVSFEQGILLNMGQILSLPFILIGGVILYFAIRKNRLKASDESKPATE